MTKDDKLNKINPDEQMTPDTPLTPDEQLPPDEQLTPNEKLTSDWLVEWDSLDTENLNDRNHLDIH